MATPPFLVESDDGYRLDVGVGRSGRERLALSDRATGLLVDDLGYGNRDIVPWLTAKTLVLAGGATRRDGTGDARELAWAIAGADGGRAVTDAELERLGEYLASVDVDHPAVETAREHVNSTRLAEIIDPSAVTGTRERTQDLRDLAKDL